VLYIVNIHRSEVIRRLSSISVWQYIQIQGESGFILLLSIQIQGESLLALLCALPCRTIKSASSLSAKSPQQQQLVGQPKEKTNSPFLP
jgi:hypothetical protein